MLKIDQSKGSNARMLFVNTEVHIKQINRQNSKQLIWEVGNGGGQGNYFYIKP